MEIQIERVVVVDVESTCWEKNRNPAGQISEIIEIGVCTLAIETGQREDKRSIFVAPESSQVSPFCTQLTTITQEMVDEQGIPFADACAILRDDYQTQSRLWVSWGNYDRRMFIEQCEQTSVEYPFSQRHCNLKNLYAKTYGDRMGMAQAMGRVGLDLEGTHHRGGDDAWNIARILEYLLTTHGPEILEKFW